MTRLVGSSQLLTPYVIASLFSNCLIHGAKGSTSAKTSIQNTSPVLDKQELERSYPENQNLCERLAPFLYSNAALFQKWLHLFFSNKSVPRWVFASAGKSWMSGVAHVDDEEMLDHWAMRWRVWGKTQHGAVVYTCCPCWGGRKFPLSF